MRSGYSKRYVRSSNAVRIFSIMNQTNQPLQLADGEQYISPHG